MKRVKVEVLEAENPSPPLQIKEEFSAPHSKLKLKRTKSVGQPKDYPFEFGKIISTGMIGVVYLARKFMPELGVYNLWCIKLMLFSKMHEKNIFPSISRELKILLLLKGVKGCMQLQESQVVSDLVLDREPPNG